MKICPISNREIQGRSNKIYYSYLERRKANNDKNNAIRKARAFCDKPLQQNFRILNELTKGKKEVTVHKEYLKGKGYSFALHTHYQTHNGETFPAIYNYILFSLNDNIKIINIK